MKLKAGNHLIEKFILTYLILCSAFSDTSAQEQNKVNTGNFGLPGIIDLPTGRRLPDGELVFMQQLHKSLSRAGVSFQALLGF